MQRILKTNGNINEYVELDKDYPFPEQVSEYCQYCKHLMRFSRHGFYLRYFISQVYRGAILVRRYICQCKRTTLSLLPDFCLFKIATSFAYVFLYTYRAYFKETTFRETLRQLNEENSKINMSRQLLYFYRKRFMDNSNLISEGIRLMNQNIRLPDRKLNKYERAKELLRMVKYEIETLTAFTETFFKKTNKSPFALIK